MKKITLFFMSLFLAFGTAMAQNEENAEFALQYSRPTNGEVTTAVYNVILGFNKDVTATLPAEGIDVVNNETKEVVKITRIYSDEWSPKNQVTFLFEQETVAGKDGGEELRDKVIETPGTYSYTIPAGVIKSVDGDEFPETTFTFSIVGTFPLVDYSPKETTSLEKIELTFEKEIVDVKIPNGGFYLTDYNWSQFFNVKNEYTISDDKKTVTLELETPITEQGQYFFDMSLGAFISADGINAGKSLSFNVIDPAPRFETNYQDGDKVKELGNFEITFKNVKEVVLLQDKLTVYLPGSGEAEGTATLADNKITVTFNQQFTEEGDYLFYIPEGMFTMDGVKNEERQINVNLYTFSITPLEIVSVTPEVGKVDQIEKIYITFNQIITLSYDENSQQISQEINLTCGDQTYTLTYTPEGYNATNQLIYCPNAEWDGYKYTTTPITAAGSYTLNLADIIVDYAAEMVSDEYGTYVGKWHGKNGSCSGTYTWTIGNDAAVDNIKVANGEQAIYDLLGRRVERITEAGLYIVNGKKVIIK